MENNDFKELKREVEVISRDIEAIKIHLQYMKESEEARKKRMTDVVMYIIGGFISIAILWVVSGGLYVK